MTIKISTGLPNCREGRQNLIGSVTVNTIQRIARCADELGYYALWPNEFLLTDPSVSNRYAAPPALYDTIVTMSYAAAATERIRLTPSTIVLPFHEPILLSRQIATLDAFSNGRITLGVGLGGTTEQFRRVYHGLEKPNRGQMMDEYVEALRVLWTSKSATFHGRYTSFENIEAYPHPVQDPLPIFMAGEAEGVFRRLAAHGQGWIDASQLPDDLKKSIETLSTYAREAGRPEAHFEIARQFYVSIARTEEEARANHAASFPPATVPQAPAAGSSRMAGPTREASLIGTPEQILARLREYAAVGVTELCVIFYHPNDDSVEAQLRLFAEEVKPALESQSPH